MLRDFYLSNMNRVRRQILRKNEGLILILAQSCGSVAQSCDRLAPFVGSRVRFPVAVLQPRGERL